MSDLVAIFGYGSLVNAATHRTPVVATVSAELDGWRRVWRRRPPNPDSPRDGIAFLSVEEAPGTTIQGVLMIDRAASLPDLDRREALYDRVPLDRSALRILEDHPALAPDVPCFIYRAAAAAAAGEAPPPRMIRSYLDAVFQGFHARFGEGAVEAFLASTADGALEVDEDRERPIYPRAVRLTQAERAAFDRLLPPRPRPRAGPEGLHPPRLGTKEPESPRVTGE